MDTKNGNQPQKTESRFFQPTNLITTFFAALAGAAMLAISNAEKKP